MQDLPLGPGNLVQTDKRREGEASFSLVCSSSTMERFFFLRRVKTIAFSQLDKDKRRRAHFLSLFLFHHALSLLCRARSSKKKVTTTTLPAAALKGKEKRWTSPRPLPPPAAAWLAARRRRRRWRRRRRRRCPFWQLALAARLQSMPAWPRAPPRQRPQAGAEGRRRRRRRLSAAASSSSLPHRRPTRRRPSKKPLVRTTFQAASPTPTTSASSTRPCGTESRAPGPR